MGLIDLFKISDFKSQIQSLKRENAALSDKLSSLEGENYFSIQGKVGELNSCYDQRLQESQTLSVQIRDRFEKVKELDQQIIEKQRQLTKIKELYQGIEAAVQNYRSLPLEYAEYKLDDKYLEECEKFAPSVRLTISCMNPKELHEAYLLKEKIITDLFRQYTNEFSTSSDKAVYELAVLYIRAEIQNILYDIKKSTTDTVIGSVNNLCKRCLRIADNANLTSLGSFTKFIGELESHLFDLVQIEATYCGKKQRDDS